jgi:hypothetical protein
MMKNTKKNWIVVALLTVATVAGNIGTNYVIAKKNGYTWNKETKQMEKMCILGIDLKTEYEIDKSNLVWGIIGAVAGTVLHYTVIDR